MKSILTCIVIALLFIRFSLSLKLNVLLSIPARAILADTPALAKLSNTRGGEIVFFTPAARVIGLGSASSAHTTPSAIATHPTITTVLPIVPAPVSSLGTTAVSVSNISEVEHDSGEDNARKLSMISSLTTSADPTTSRTTEEHHSEEDNGSPHSMLAARTSINPTTPATSTAVTPRTTEEHHSNEEDNNVNHLNRSGSMSGHNTATMADIRGSTRTTALNSNNGHGDHSGDD
jgi:hypothetical protein